MDRQERIHRLHRIFRAARRPVAPATLMDELGCSRATLYRDIAYLRDALGAPIERCREPDGFQYAKGEQERFELPGLWLSADELHALLAAHQLLSRTGQGILSGALSPLKARIDDLLAEQTRGRRFPVERVRVIGIATRRVDEAAFRVVATAVLERRQLEFDYRARSNDQISHRRVSPQRLSHYRDNWYLDAFDHDREALRSFAVDRIRVPRRLEEPARDLPDEELDAHFASSYGIFAGPARQWATIRFSPHAARWVADEHWHSRQEGRFTADGGYELRVPYSHSRELLMDVLRYGPDAEIVDPPALRAEMRILLQLAVANYGG
ncbi:MAG: transcriptional regulator [Lysobacteraceae bacterium]|nr:MAG: transcriptional regulator [Xanthomonadaceae bacterium]